MRITIVADGSIPAEGDCSRDPQVLADGLRSLGHAVTLLMTSDNASSLPKVSQTGTAANGNISPIPSDGSDGLALLTVTPDILLSIGMASPVISAVLASSRGIPLVISLPAELFGPVAPASGYSRLICQHLPYSRLLVESDRHSSMAEQFGADPHKIFVVPPGMKLDHYALPSEMNGTGIRMSDQDRLRILFDVSCIPLDEQRFIESVLNQLVTKRHRRIHTFVLAADDCPRNVRRLWEGRSETTLVPDRTAVPHLYVNSDVVMAPSATTDETLPVMRAMAAGRPLVAADCPQNRDVVSTIRHGILARPGRADEWVDKLEYLLDEALLRSHLGKSARARAETSFSFPQTLGQIEKLLSAVKASWRYVPTSDF
jgi:glycosyltransferase involved in cell wall biosynthesis